MLIVYLLICRVDVTSALPRVREVATRQGAVRGYLTHGYYAFLGVPYAHLRTRRDRFKAPEPPPSWDGIFEATHRVRCPQRGGGEENCLVANLFVWGAARAHNPVLVLLHDGFEEGWGVYKPPSRFIQDHIIVSINYRIGTLGYLCLGTTEVPGNAGLKDQVAALYWINMNIAAFGGNPYDVTLYGVGAGSVSIQMLLLSGLVQGLVHKAILESGSVLSPTSMVYNPFATALKEAVSLGYKEKDYKDDLNEFYQSLSVNTLVNMTNFLPCIENNFYYFSSLLYQDPILILRAGDFVSVPVIVIYGKAKELRLIGEDTERFSVNPTNFMHSLPNNLEFNSEETRYRVAEVVKQFYFDDDEFATKQSAIENYMEYVNDVLMDYPIMKFATMFAAISSKPVFLMKFSYGDINGNQGALRYFYAKDSVENNDVTADRMTILFKNFIKFGDPTPLITELVPTTWQNLSPADPDMELGKTEIPGLVFDRTISMAHLQTNQLRLWDRIYKKFYKLHLFDAPNPL